MNQQTIHEKYMARCIELAYNGLGNTYPNPMVGSVIVHEGKIIGEGWHRQAGCPHAEVNAIASVKHLELLPESTLYVSLEPCSHYGKTPPCADLVIEKKIKKIFIGIADPFAQVSGRGIQKLKEAGCEVTVGILEKECYELNKRFFTFHQQKRPYIILKWAETADGFIAPKFKNNIEPQWISNVYSRQLVHLLRSREQAILVGTNTVLDDNPKLDTRDWYGKNPLRVVVDASLKIPQNYAVWDGSTPTLFLTDKPQNVKYKLKNIEFATIDFSKELPSEIANLLYQKGIQSLIVEGGKNILQQFIDSGYWNEAQVFTGKNQFGAGLLAPSLRQAVCVKKQQIADDVLTIYKKEK